MKTKLLVVLFMVIGLGAKAATVDLEQLQSTIKSMQQMITNLQQEIIELKKERGMPTAPPTQPPPSEKGVEFIPPSIKNPPQPSQVTPRDTINDYQEAAQRPGNLTLDPKYTGFIPVPNTPVFMKFNAKVHLDGTFDTQNSGNRDRFTPALIPVEGDPNHGGGTQYNMNARASSLSLDVRAPEIPGTPRFYYNNDFLGGGVNNGMGYRIKQLYGQIYNITAGYTFSVFEDPDVWPDTVDSEGPNSMIFARQPTVRYMLPLNDHWQLNFGVQQPSSEVDTFGINGSSVDHAPDGGFNVRWEDSKVGHVQFGTIFREVGAESDTLGKDSVLGWGLMLASSLNVFERDSVQGQLTYGEGYFHFINDNFTYNGFEGGDAAYDADGHLKALPCFSAMAGYTHRWSDKFRSTATVGYVNLDNKASEGPLAYHETFYSSLNVVYQLRKRLSIGMEALYGRKEDNNGQSGDVFRLQVGMVFSLFD